MTMKILLVPTIRETYKNQFEYSVDLRLINFLKKTFKSLEITIYNGSNNDNYNLIILTGGNNSNLIQKKDKIRNNINNKIFNFALKKKIKLLGICHGAHFLAEKLRFKIQKKSGHVGNHEVFFYTKDLKINKRVVNSYHNEVIKRKKSKIVNSFGISEDDTIEAFHVKKMNILGIMWHPERYSKIKSFDQKLIKEFYATNSIIGW